MSFICFYAACVAGLILLPMVLGKYDKGRLRTYEPVFVSLFAGIAVGLEVQMHHYPSATVWSAYSLLSLLSWPYTFKRHCNRIIRNAVDARRRYRNNSGE